MLVDMESDANETDEQKPQTWQTLSAATGRVLGNPNKQQDEDRERTRRAGDEDEQRRENHRANVEYGLRQLAAFERRCRGIGIRRFRRN
jgi:hypothetical protein